MKQKVNIFISWFQELGNAWVQKNPDAVLSLLADKFLYYETPFTKPFTTKKEILLLWQEVPNSQKNISFSFDLLSINNNTGIAHWKASFTRLKSNKKAHLDGIFLVRLNQKGLCTLFKMWYNSKE